MKEEKVDIIARLKSYNYSTIKVPTGYIVADFTYVREMTLLLDIKDSDEYTPLKEHHGIPVTGIIREDDASFVSLLSEGTVIVYNPS